MRVKKGFNIITRRGKFVNQINMSPRKPRSCQNLNYMNEFVIPHSSYPKSALIIHEINKKVNHMFSVS